MRKALLVVRKVLSVPASQCSSERLIKKGKVVLDEERFALDPILAEKQILLKANAPLLERLGIFRRVFAGVKAVMEGDIAGPQAQAPAQPPQGQGGQ
jgi:hAT family C-terminal dimerisation region